MSKEKRLSYFMMVKNVVDPLLTRLEKFDTKVPRDKIVNPAYYRNEDLKKIFGLSNNTIVKYRQTGILPYTKLGDIFLYDSSKIDKILQDNKVEL